MQIQIQVLSVQINQATTKTGKPYEIVEVAYKNLTFQGKVEGRKIMPFGTTASTHAVLSKATTGQVYDITVVKGDTGYNDWTVAALSDGAAPAAAAAAPQGITSSKAAVSPKSTYETPEERAQRQILIVRQSSLSAACSTLAVGAKAVKPADVIAVAKQYEDYVFGIKDVGPTGFDDLPDFDVPEVM